jgi:HD-GYP domain-containing protein (c-di-GMP phosphodiesterase class II)
MTEPRTDKLLHAFAALADLGEQIATTRDFEEMVRSTLHVVLGALGIRRGAVAEFYAAESRLKMVATWGLAAEAPDAFDFEAEPPPPAAPQPPPAPSDEYGPLASFERRFRNRFRAELERLRVPLAVPLVVHTELVGVIMLGGKATEEQFTDEDREVVRTMARHIGVGIYNHRLLREVERRAVENRKLYEDMRAIYRDTVRAFAAAIDCKDKYTQGHSERVGKYTEIIARELGWPEEQVEDIAIGGYLHDVGKLVVERDIINAPYRIDAKQSSELNRHPAAGYEILAPLNHPDATIPMIAKYHHERPDGRGYPEGLSGDDIPLSARIVSVADSFDAMTTDRTYKRRKELPEVVEDFRKNTGLQFAHEAVVALFRAMLKEIEGESRERRFAKLLGRDYLQPEVSRPLVISLLSELDARQHAAAGAG